MPVAVAKTDTMLAVVRSYHHRFIDDLRLSAYNARLSCRAGRPGSRPAVRKLPQGGGTNRIRCALEAGSSCLPPAQEKGSGDYNGQYQAPPSHGICERQWPHRGLKSVDDALHRARFGDKQVIPSWRAIAMVAVLHFLHNACLHAVWSCLLTATTPAQSRAPLSGGQLKHRWKLRFFKSCAALQRGD